MQTQVLSRALNTHNYKKDVVETGGGRDKNPSNILGKAQDSLFSSKTGLRLFRGGSQHDIGALTAADETETLDLRDPSWTNSNNLTNNSNLIRASANSSSSMGLGPMLGGAAASGGSFLAIGGGGGGSPAAAAAGSTAAGGGGAAAAESSLRVGKVRRSSMTTYTINLGGGMGGQVEREVRRLAGLNAFARPSQAEVPVAHATSFDEVQEMGADSLHGASSIGDECNGLADGGGYGAGGGAAAATGRGGAGGGAARQAFGSPHGSSLLSDPVNPDSSTGGGGGGGGCGSSSSTGVVVSLVARRSSVGSSVGGGGYGSSGGAGGGDAGATSMEICDFEHPASPRSPAPLPSVELRTQRLNRLPSSTHISLGGAGAGGGGGNGSPTALQGGGLGLMRDRKGGAFGGGAPLRAVSTDCGIGGGGSGLTSPSVAATAAASTTAGGSASSLPKLPLLQMGAGPSRASSSNVTVPPSNGSASPLTHLSPLSGVMAAAVAAAAAGSDSRSNSGRLVLPPSIETRGSGPLEPITALGAVGGGGAADVSSGIIIGGGGGGAVGTGAGGGGRWFQQEAEDLHDMLYGSGAVSGGVGGSGNAVDETLLSLMSASSSTALAASGPTATTTAVTTAFSRGLTAASNVDEVVDVGVDDDVTTTTTEVTPIGGGDTSAAAAAAFSLPRLSDLLPEKAAATLQELRRFQATLDDHVARERQAMAAGRVRRTSVLEDAVGSHQPRWQSAYNSDVSLNGKLALVDAVRRTEPPPPADRSNAHLSKLSKDGRAAAGQGGGGGGGGRSSSSGGGGLLSGGGGGSGGGVLPAAAAVSPVVARARRLSTVTAA
ncbi:hypothetical protein Agub_g14776 [Astrephomene gubernaculifera]|uniref:Uncharacterized protein n=1 Tax=Astrephomene gubernaculifera TaxID=47775 RepID=A0AAD3E469_9CHLO|nr:hypothetical protein Agub_g14776 [Astrephomene gubernaculifera]